MFHSVTLDPIGFINLVTISMAVGTLIPTMTILIVASRDLSKSRKIARDSREATAKIQEGK